MNQSDIISHLRLLPHPEGGFFRETYRSAEVVPEGALAERYGGARAVSTAIYFMLTGETFSAFHRLRSDEIWHYYAGEPAELHLLFADGRHTCVIVGPDLAAGMSPQVVIPHGCWFASRVVKPDGYILLGCTVAPGFEFSDFDLARRDELIHLFPQHHHLITSFTRQPYE